jgi:phytoene synthase
LPKPKRDALASLYAFMRLVDDVADEANDLAAKQRGLVQWRLALDTALLDRVSVENPPPKAGLVLPALVDTLRRYNMPARYIHDLISGAEMDLTNRTYPTFERLRKYCYRVAGTVGLTCTHVFGFKDPRALDLAGQIRPVQVEDVLGREPVEVDLGAVASYLADETVLVTGAGGSIGSELCRQIAAYRPSMLVLYEMNEYAIYKIDEQLRPAGRVEQHFGNAEAADGGFSF